MGTQTETTESQKEKQEQDSVLVEGGKILMHVCGEQKEND